MGIIKPGLHYLVVAEDFCHEFHKNAPEGVAAVYRAEDAGLPCRLFVIAREIDLDEWAPCEYCGRPIHNNTGCWWKPCIEAHH